MSRVALEREPIVAAEEERSTLERVCELATHLRLRGQQAALIGSSGETIPLPASLFCVLQQAADALRQGDAITVVPVHKELTTQQAAEILNVSRQYLVRLLDAGKIPFTKTGTHRRIKYGDLISYKHQRDLERHANLDRLTQMSQKLGLYGKKPR